MSDSPSSDRRPSACRPPHESPAAAPGRPASRPTSRASTIRNVSVFGSLALLLALLTGCPQTASEQPAQPDPSASTAEAPEPPAARPSNDSPPQAASPANSADSTERPPGNTAANNNAANNTAASNAASPASPRVEPGPAGQQPPAANAPPQQPAEPEDIELFAPRNGDSAAAQAPVEGAYAARQPAPKQPAPKQPLFQQWPRPRAALVLTGRQHGYIEPCGCTGLANQKGGLARRHSLLKQLAADGWPLAPLDAGNQVRRFGRQAEIKFQMTAAALRSMNYQAVGLGPDDLRLSFGELAAALAEEGPGGESLFVSANVNMLDLTPKFRVFEVGGKKIGLTTVLGKQAQQHVTADEIELADPVESLKAVMPELRQAGCDLLILLAQASQEECEALARDVPGFDLVVSAGGAGEPGHDFLPIEQSKARLINLGAKGMHAVVVGLYDDAAQPLRYQRVPLDDRFPDSPEMLKLVGSYQSQLETLGLEGLGLRPIAHPREATFVGSETCADCHFEEHEIWAASPHAHATESLVHPGERTEIARHFDPECLSCHVTGWNPQGYYPYQSGYLDLARSKHLHGNGCENCHGPGSKHVAVELGELAVSDEEQMQLRRGMRLTLADAKANHCMTCHDLDNSPDFHEPGAFEKYWKQIEHGGD